jgi:hypothetical protein
MRPARIITAIIFAAAIAITGCSAYSSADQPSSPPNTTHAPRLPIDRTGPPPVDRQAPIYAAVLRQYLTTGGGHDGGDAGFGGFRFRVSSCWTMRWPSSAAQGGGGRRVVRRSR